MTVIQNFQKLLAYALLIVVGVSCSAPLAAPTSTPVPPPTAAPTATVAPLPSPTVELTPTPAFPLAEGVHIFEKPNGKKFTGTVYGQGETAIVLANMTAGGQGQWDPFVREVDREKFSTVTFSYIQPDYTGVVQEIGIVLNVLRASGYKRVICIGASLGVTACANIAEQPEIVGIALIAGPNGGSLKGDYPKLYVAGETDIWSVDTKQEYERASEPKTLVLYPGNGMHGTQLFGSLDGDQFLELLINFVNEAEQN